MKCKIGIVLLSIALFGVGCVSYKVDEPLPSAVRCHLSSRMETGEPIFGTMAVNDFVCTIRASGGDYTNLSTWEVAIQSDLTVSNSMVFTVSSTGTYSSATDDGTNVTFTGGGTGWLHHINSSSKAYITQCSGLISNGTVTVWGSSNTFTVADTGQQVGLAIAECYNDWPSGLDDTVTISGWTTDSDNYVKITTPTSERHNGVPKSGANYTGFAIKESGSWVQTLELGEHYTVVEGIIVDAAGKSGVRALQVTSVDNTVVKECILMNATYTGADGYYVVNSSAEDNFIVNSLVLNCTQGIEVNSYAYRQRIYNCTLAGCTSQGLYFHGGGSPPRTHYVKNCLFYTNNTSVYNANPAATIEMEYCSADDDHTDDFGGTGNRTNQTFTFVGASTNNFHLSASDAGARTYGTDLFADSFYPLHDDVDGDTRVYPWDIGFDQVTLTGPQRYFVGDTDSDWNDTNNWAILSGWPGGASVPGSSEWAIFDQNSPDCAADISVQVGTLSSVTGFTNELDCAGYDFRVNDSCIWSDGTFLGSNGTLRFDSGLHTYGGTFQLSSGLTRCPATSGNWDMVLYGQVLHNNGTLQTIPNYGSDFDIDVGTNALYNWRLGVDGQFTDFTVVTNVVVSNDLTFVEQTYGGRYFYGSGKTIYLHGDLLQEHGSSAFHFYDAVPTIRMVGTGDQTWFSDRFSDFPKLIIDKPSGNLVMTGLLSIATSFNYIQADGITAPGGTPTFAMYAPGAGDLYLTIAGTPTFPCDFVFTRFGACGLVLSGTFHTTGSLTYVRRSSFSGGGLHGGIYQVEGNLDLSGKNSNPSEHTAQIQLIGGDDQTAQFDDNYFPSGGLTVDKTNGTVTLVSDFNIGNVPLIVTDGILDFSGYDVTCSGSFSISGTVKLRGDESVSYGSADLSNGTVEYYDSAVTADVSPFASATVSNLVCGSGSTKWYYFPTGLVNEITIAGTWSAPSGTVYYPVQFRSLVDGVQWYVDLQGSSALSNHVGVKDSNAGSGNTVYALGSADYGNNINWFGLMTVTDGVWNYNGSDSWTNNSRWTGGQFAYGVGKTGDISQVNISANSTITISTNILIGSILLADAGNDGSNTRGWTLSNVGYPIMLHTGGVGTPEIRVGSRQSNAGNRFYIYPELQGTEGLHVERLGGVFAYRRPVYLMNTANSISGTMTVTNGWVVANDDNAFGACDIAIYNDGRVELVNFAVVTNNVSIYDGGAFGGGIYAAQDANTVHTNGTITLYGLTNYIQTGNADQTIYSPIVGTNTNSVLVFQGVGNGSYQEWVILRTNNTYVGQTVLNPKARVRVYDPDAFGLSTNTVYLRGGSSYAYEAFLYMSAALDTRKTLWMEQEAFIQFGANLVVSNTIISEDGCNLMAILNSGQNTTYEGNLILTNGITLFNKQGGLSAGAVYLNGVISGPGSMFIAGYSSNDSQPYFNATNTYSGGTRVQRQVNEDLIYAGNDAAWGTGPVWLDSDTDTKESFRITQDLTMTNDFRGRGKIGTGSYDLTLTGTVRPYDTGYDTVTATTNIGTMYLADATLGLSGDRLAYVWQIDDTVNDIITCEDLHNVYMTMDLTDSYIGTNKWQEGEYTIITWTGSDPTNVSISVTLPPELKGATVVTDLVNNTIKLDIDTFIYYVTEGGSGTQDGSSWTNAFDQIQDALNDISFGTERNRSIQPEIYVAQSTGTNSFAVANYTGSIQNPTYIYFYGGYDTNTLTVVGRSKVRGAGYYSADSGLHVEGTGADHGEIKRMFVRSFDVKEVEDGIVHIVAPLDDARCTLSMSNCVIRAGRHGGYLYYNKTFNRMGPITLEFFDGDVCAGTATAGYALFTRGPYLVADIRRSYVRSISSDGIHQEALDSSGWNASSGSPQTYLIESTVERCGGHGVFYHQYGNGMYLGLHSYLYGSESYITDCRGEGIHIYHRGGNNWSGGNAQMRYILRLTNTVVAANSSHGVKMEGTGITVQTGGVQAYSYNSTIANNTSNGLWLTQQNTLGNSQSYFYNTIIAENMRNGFEVSDGDGLGALLTEDYNCANNALTNFVVNGAEQAASANDVLYNPSFKGLPGTEPYNLRAGSSCIDAASATYAPPTDIRGVTRPQGVADDIGAYEVKDGVPVGHLIPQYLNELWTPNEFYP